jgi:hypothetical protein
LIIRMNSEGLDLSRQSGLWSKSDFLAVRVSNQFQANRDLPELFLTKTDLRLAVSIEPMFGAVDLVRWLWMESGTKPIGRIKLVRVVGSVGRRAMPMHPAWVRMVRDQCRRADVPFLFAGWGRWYPFEQETNEVTRRWLTTEKTAFVGLNGRVIEPVDGRIPTVSRDFERMVAVGAGKSGRKIDGQEWRGIDG